MGDYSREDRPSDARHHRRTWRQFFQIMGPGIVSGASDNDPAGVVTYIQIGATTGFGLLWLMFLSTAMLYCFEEISTRLAGVTKQGISRIVRTHYGPVVAGIVVMPLILSNIITIGADLAGTGAAVQLITGIAWEWWIIPLAFGLGLALFYTNYRTMSRFLLFLTPLFLLYIATGFVAHPKWGDVLHATFFPTIQIHPNYLEAALALLGATLTPYIFFWQANEEVEAHLTVANLTAENWDVAGGMIYSNLVDYFIILVAGAVLFGHESVVRTVAEAAVSLRPLAGPAASLLFSLGIVLSGILAIPVMAACSAYALAENFGWAGSLDKKVWQARAFYIMLAGALGVGAAIAHLRISPIMLMYWSQILNGLLLPPLLVVLLLLADNPQVVRTYTNRLASKLVGWGTVLLTLWLAIEMIRQLLSGR